MSETTATKELTEDRSFDPIDAFGLLRSYIAHRAHLAEAVGLVRAELERRVTVHDLLTPAAGAENCLRLQRPVFRLR